MMVPLWVALISFGLSLVLTPVCRDLALRWGWVDQPEHGAARARPIPRIGGVPVLLACVLSVALVAGAWPAMSALLPAGLLVFACGLCDDLYGLSPWQKLVIQIAGAAMACAAGVRIDHVAAHAIPPPWGVALTIAWLVGAMNALNLVDGVDGLAGGVGFLAALTIVTSALLHGHTALALAAAPLAGALVGFLRYNFAPASIFLGDCGSLTLGFLLGAYGVIWSHKTDTLLGMAAPLMALSIPLLDTAVAIVRRAWAGQPIFRGDRCHIHHRLLERGLTPRSVALLLYAVSGLGGVLSLLASRY